MNVCCSVFCCTIYQVSSDGSDFMVNTLGNSLGFSGSFSVQEENTLGMIQPRL